MSQMVAAEIAFPLYRAGRRRWETASGRRVESTTFCRVHADGGLTRLVRTAGGDETTFELTTYRIDLKRDLDLYLGADYEPSDPEAFAALAEEARLAIEQVLEPKP